MVEYAADTGFTCTAPRGKAPVILQSGLGLLLGKYNYSLDGPVSMLVSCCLSLQSYTYKPMAVYMSVIIRLVSVLNMLVSVHARQLCSFANLPVTPYPCTRAGGVIAETVAM